ncbi:hypothetical protein FQ377_11490 [Arthrobacter echini]|uniref:Uncharacterized protein n=1 Tax=Arthrobacter echini TaxID=1529066 RepID=A0A5D0XN51_9MICC|nr:hypothetical protein [Arthrobacter echini]TYC97840.1 hypothetical protein FQ377_11490 [Arthrobacter echini]
MLTVPEDFPSRYISYLEAQDEHFAETVLMVMKQSMVEKKHGILVGNESVDRHVELSETVPFGEVDEGII